VAWILSLLFANHCCVAWILSSKSKALKEQTHQNILRWKQLLFCRVLSRKLGICLLWQRFVRSCSQIYVFNSFYRKKGHWK
jgi:hypothetical protein